jgi:uncharacterized protein YutE (UPF0331/DUF86 family)
MVDPARLRALLDRLDEEIEELRRFATLSPEELVSDRAWMGAVKYGFIVTIEICIDVGEHVISSERLRGPSSFADIFTILGENGYLSEDIVPALRSMARFRNLLVHGYQRVDDARVVEILRSHLDDLEVFRSQIARDIGR